MYMCVSAEKATKRERERVSVSEMEKQLKFDQRIY